VRHHKRAVRKRAQRANGSQRSLGRQVIEIRPALITRRIISQKANLRHRIKADKKLTRDFDFLVKKTGWHPDKLLRLLYWDCNMMHADLQTILRKIKRETWPVDRNIVEMILRNLSGLAEQIARVNETKFSPVRTAVLRDSNGVPLGLKKQEDLQDAANRLPDILRFFRGELQRRFNLADYFWKKRKKTWKSIFERTRQSSIYEGIRLATPDNKYNANRLLRLINTSREVQGLPSIELRAFIIWLNKSRKRYSNQTAYTPSGSAKSTSSPREL
jgi:hypothetical protein